MHVYEKGKPASIEKVIGTIRVHQHSRSEAIKELVARARAKGANAIYNINPIMGYGCGSPTGPQDIVITGWAATAVVERGP